METFQLVKPYCHSERYPPVNLLARGTYHVFDDLILAIMLLYFEEMVAEIQHCKAPLLPEQHDDHAAGPVQPIAKTLPKSKSTQRSHGHSGERPAGPPTAIHSLKQHPEQVICGLW